MPPQPSDTDVFTEIHRGDGAPEMSILMPVCNRARYVASAVESVLAQRGACVEIIISDDASDDASLDTARLAVRRWLATRGSPHRIVMRHGRRRLRRDHLALLTERASCDIVCQAHDDDLSHPERARRMLEAFRADPGITMVTCKSVEIDAQGKRMPTPRHRRSEEKLETYSIEGVMSGQSDLIGFAIAWRRSAIACFERLDSRLAAMGHDRILAFRAALAGRVVRSGLQLVARRVHDEAWSRTMFFEPRGHGDAFGWSLSRVSELSVQAADLERALEAGLLPAPEHARLAALLRQQQARQLDRMLRAMRQLTRRGREIAWVDRDTVARLKREEPS